MSVGIAASASSSSAPVAIFASDSGELTVLYEDGSTKGLGVNGQVAGPMKNLDDDKYLEAPYVSGSSDLHIVDTTGSHQTLVSGDAKNQKTYFATGDWDGDGRVGVVYENTSNGKLYRVEVGTTPAAIVGPDGKPIATNGPVGFADYDTDGDEDLIFLGSSSTIKFYDGTPNDEDTSIESTAFSSFGSSGALGIGAPADFNNDGKPRVPYVDGSKNLKLLNASGNKFVFSKNATSEKAPIAATNLGSDTALELLYVNYSSNHLYYANADGTVNPVTQSDGTKITAHTDVGVYPAAAPPAPDISNYTVSNPSGRELQVSFNASEQIVNISVAVDGPGGHDFTLTESNFTETGNGPYHYAATTTVAVDGNYTATLTVAEDADGADGGTGQNGTVSVQTPYPNVTNVTLVDATNDDGYVGGGDTVRVTATVTNESTVTSVTANASAFGAGTVALAHVSGDKYATNVTVDAAGVPTDGPADVAVTATNEYDHSDTNSSGTVFVDTTPPNADAGPDMTIEEDTEATFDGDGSTDNSVITGYTWTFDDGHTETGVTTTETFADPGTYTVDLTVTDTVGHTATDTVTVTVENVTDSDVVLNVTDATLTDVTDGDGYVGGDDTVRVTATIENESAIKTVRADASKFGAGTVNLSHVSGDKYAATFAVDAANVSDDGRTAIQVTAIDKNHYVDTGTTGGLFIDTTAPTADAGANITVEEDTRVVFDGAGSTDNAEISQYRWTLESGTTLTGATPTHTYADPGTYTVGLTVTDTVGHTATDSVTVTVTNVSEGSTTTTTTTEVVYVESDDEETTTETTQTRNSTVTNGTATLTVRNVDANESLLFSVPAETAGTDARLRTVTVVTAHAGDARVLVTPNETAPTGVVGLGETGQIEPVGYWNLTATNTDSATLRFQVPEERLGAAGPDAVSLYRHVDGTWKRIDAQHVRTENGTLQFVARVPDANGTSIFGVGIRRGNLTVSAVAVPENETAPGHEVIVHATVTNDGARAVTETLTLRVDGNATANRTVTVPAHRTRNITFAYEPDSAGNYTLAVGDTAGETVAVRNASSGQNGQQEDDDTTPAGSALGLLGALALAGVSYGIGRSDVDPAELLE